MKYIKIYSLLLCILITNTLIRADVNSEFDDLFLTEENAEKINEKEEELARLKKEKLDINRAEFEDLIKLPWLSPVSIDKILTYRKQNTVKNIESLQKAGLNQETIDNIRPYIKFTKMHYPLDFNYRIRTQYNSTTEYSHPFKFYQRLTLDYRNYTLNLLSQKDSGEDNYFDFYSGSMEVKNLSCLDKLVIGNYRLAFGQGIIFSPKLGLAKGYNTTGQPLKSSSGLRSYTSASENFSLFGAAAKFSGKGFHVIPYYSNYDLDATIENNAITSIYDPGYHRTSNEKSKKDRLQEVLYGCNISYGTRNQISLHAHHIEFNYPFAAPDIKQKNNIFGLEFRYFFKNFYIFGESGYADNKFAHIAGLFFEVNDFKNLVIYRNYANHFPTFHGNPFHAGGEFDNERGIYYGIDFSLPQSIDVRLYFDLYKFPAGSFYTDIPSYGTDKMLAVSKEWSNTTLRFIYKNDLKEQWKSVNETSKLYRIDRTRLRLDVKYELSESMQLKGRFEYSFHDYKNADKYDDGFLMYEEIRFTLFSNLKNYLRIVQYQSDNIQLYMYENDISGVMQNSQFSGDGIAGYFLIKYNLWQHYSLQFKYSQEFWKRNIGYHTGFERQLGKTYILKAQLEIDF